MSSLHAGKPRIRLVRRTRSVSRRTRQYCACALTAHTFLLGDASRHALEAGMRRRVLVTGDKGFVVHGRSGQGGWIGGQGLRGVHKSKQGDGSRRKVWRNL